MDAAPDILGFADGPALGAGRTATVRRGVHLATGRAVALKTARDDTLESALMAQLAVAGRVRHPGVCPALGTTRDAADALTLVMALAPGAPLGEGLPPTLDPVAAALALTEALAAVHAAGLVHGDLSPHNVMVSADAQASLIDLGDADGHTVGYIAPELMAGAAPTAASDRFSLGCLLADLFLPPEHEISAWNLAPLESLPPALAGVLRRLLAEDPADRFAGTEAVVERLAAFAGQDPEARLARFSAQLLQSGRLPPLPAGVAQVQAALGSAGLVEVSGPSASGVIDAAGPCPAGWAILALAGPRPLEQLATALACEPVEALTQLVARAATHPVVLAVDTQEMDAPARRDLLAGLTGATRVAPILAVVTGADARPDPDAVPKAIDWLLDLDPPSASLLSQTLTDAGLRGGQRAQAALVGLAQQRVLVRRAGRWRLDQDALASATIAANPAARMAQLGSAGQALVTAAALIGEAVSRATLATISGAPSSAFDDAIDAGLLIERGEEVVASAPIQRAVAPADHAPLHRAILAQLDTIFPPDARAVACVWHTFWSSGAAPTPADAVAVSRQMLAAGAPRRALAALDATAATLETDLQRAEVLLIRGDGAAARALLTTHAAGDSVAQLGLASVLVRTGEHGAALAALDGLDGPEAQLLRAEALLWTAAYAEADADAQAAFADPRLPVDARARAAVVAANSAWQQGGIEQAAEWAQRGAALEPSPGVRAELATAAGVAALRRGDAARARDLLEQAVTTHRQLGRTAALARSSNNLGLARYQLGDWAGARDALEEFRLLTARLDDPVELANASNNVGYLNLRLGDLDRAAQCFTTCLEQARAADYARIEPVALANLAEAECARGRPAGALFADAIARFTALGALHDRVEAGRRKIECLQLSRDPAAALRAMSALTEGVDLPEGHPEAIQIERLRILALARLAPEQAVEAADALVERVAELSDVHLRGLVQEAAGVAHLALRHTVSADSLLSAAQRIYRELGAAPDRLRAEHYLEQIRRLRRANERRGKRGDLLIDLGLAAGSTLNLDELLPRVLAQVVELLDADCGAFALFGPDGEVERAEVHGMEWAGPGHRLPVSRSLIAKARRTQRPVVVRDALTDDTFSDQRSVVLLGLRSLVGIPFNADGAVAGVLYVDTRRQTRELEDEVDLLVAIGRFVGMAVENARLFEAQQQRVQVLATMAHEFRAPLSVIVSNAGMLESDGLPGDAGEMAGEIHASGLRIQRMVDQTLELSRLDARGELADPEPVDIGRYFTQEGAPLLRYARTCGLQVVLAVEPELPTAATVPEHLAMIADNLVFNACKYARGGSTLTITVGTRADVGPAAALARPPNALRTFRHLDPVQALPATGFIQVAIHNVGPVISPELMPQLFGAYVRGARSKAGSKATGLGLAIVDQCVRRLGGAVWAASDASGTTFTFTLPRAVALPKALSESA